MSRSRYGKSTLSALIDSDSEDTHFVEAMPTPDSATENRRASKKGRGKRKAAPAKVTKTKAPARRLSGRLVAKSKQVDCVQTKPKRTVLADKTNHQNADDTEEVDEFDQNEDTEMGDELDVAVVSIKENKPQATKKKAASARGVRKNQQAAKRAAPIEQAVEKVVYESQVPEMEIEYTRGEEEIEKPVLAPIRTAHRSREHSHPRQPSQQRRRAGSTSDTERGDPVLRRKLGEMTKKYESVNLRYQDLREIGLKEAERNFERFKKQSEEKMAASQKLIASLKSDVAAYSSSSKDFRELKKKAQSQATEISSFQSQIAQLTASMAQAQSENKTLSAKLAANRIAVPDNANKAPGTAVKPNGGTRITGGTDSMAPLKENLYSDLTGLIIRSVKQDAEDDVFDCIQTGRNGTLHFKLAVTNDKSAESYEDATCSYIPQLDPSRDKDLMEMLPDYLVEEISFPRPQAAKFYARVGKALTEQA